MAMGWDDALIMGAISAAGSASAANAQSNAAQSNNSANMEVAAIGNLVNISEAAKSRDFNSREAEYARTFANNSAVDQRNWSAEQAGIQRQFNQQEAIDTRGFNASEAQKGRDFEERMSNTQYQRAVGDMQAAGLNPMLAYSQGGAGNVKGATASGSPASVGAPSGSSAQSAQASSSAQAVATTPRLENPGAGAPGSIGVAMNSGFNAANQMADLRNKDAQNALTEAQAKKTESEIPHGALTTQKMENELRVQKETLYDRMKGIKAENISKYQQAQIDTIKTDTAQWEQQRAKGELTTQQLQQNYMRANNQLTQLGIAGAENESEFQEQVKTAPQYMKFLNMILNSAGAARRAGSKTH